MEEEQNGPFSAEFQSILINSLDDGNSKELCGDRRLHSGRGPIPCDEPESLAAYPITVPSMPLSFATVQWDVPTTPTDLSPGTDNSSVDELSCSDGVSPDWVVNPLSLVPPTPTDSAEDMLMHDGIEVESPQAAISESDQQTCDSVEAEVTMSQMVTDDKEELSPYGDEEISQHEDPTVEEMAPEEETSRIPQCSGDPETPDQVGSLTLPEMEEDHPRPETVTEAEPQRQQDCCTDGENDGEILDVDERESTWSDTADDGDCVGTDSGLCCDENTGRWEQAALIQESAETEEIPMSGKDKRHSPIEESASVDQMTPPEPTETQECLQSPEDEADSEADSSQPRDHTEQGEPPDTGEEIQPQSTSSPGETAACEEVPQGSDRGQWSEVTQLTREGKTSPLTEEETDESPQGASEAEGVETSQPFVCVEGGEVEETDLDMAECSGEMEELRCLVDQQEVENMEPEEQLQTSIQSEEKEESLGSVESESSEVQQATTEEEDMEETMEGGLSDETKRTQPPEETVMKDSDRTNVIKQPDETTQTEESVETNSPEGTKQTETKESNECEQADKSQQAPAEQSEEAGQTDTPEQSETEQPEERIEPTESSDQTERTEQTERAQSNAQSTQEAEQPVSTAKREDLLEGHMEGTTEQLEGQMRETDEKEDAAVPYMNGGGVDREEAQRLAEKLFRLEGIHRTDVVRHLDKDNDFSRVVGEEYLKFFDFTGQTLDQALRAFLKVVVLIGETQERERVLQRFSSRFQQCNPHAFPSAGAVLTLTCAVMLLNTDLHGQNVGKAMSQSNFVSNLDGMNDGENFSKDLLKGLYSSIKSEPLEWAVDEKELQSSMMLPEDADPDAAMRSKSNPFQNVPHDRKATVFHKGFLKRKAHADIDGKRTPWGKRKWKTFYAVLKGMVLYLQKDDYSSDWHSSEEVVSVHHALAERAVDYTKRPHVFRLQTADWRVFLFEAASTEQMSSWIGRINLVSALFSSPPFPAAVGSQRKFTRPILPASQSSLPLDKQLQSHAAMLRAFQEDLAHLQQGFPEGRKPKARELEEHKIKEEYLQHERCRYEVYLQMLEAWSGLRRTSTSEVSASDLGLFDREVCKDAQEEEDDEADGGMKRSHSSPSLELEMAPPPVVKVRRNISERRTYRKIIIPRRNREL